ncbi:DUF885 domain-containing protein [Qipengyuania sp. YG27]|uniref:DUF885 domain-containing protein n=1 Tax=Qipengyuania mesophila TaxID=2867246 RepID=A0ABS7JT46_9SPHN|nr:DUF885 domain-containing protein [Qipengyuania mesophila]MBX7500820.1 DUF885 domain-containing protein [Qipengyuania mesophila]
MTTKLTRFASAIAIACATVSAPAAFAQDHAEHHASMSAGEHATHQLHALFEASEAAYLKRNPFAAFFRGDFTDADKLGDYSAASYVEETEAAKANLAALAGIDREVLGATDKIAYDTFEYTQQRQLVQTAPNVFPTVLALPMDHFRGLHVFYPRLSAPGALMPFDTAEDYRNNFARHREFAKIVDQVIDRFRTGAGAGITLPRMSVELMIQQLDTQLSAGPEASPYWAPVANFPDSIAEADRAALTEEHRAVLTDTLFPALQKLRDYLANDYLSQARETIAATANPGGDDYYSYRIAEMTTLPLTAAEVHQTGLSEVARINAAIDAAKAEANGRTAETYTTKADLQQAWYDVAEQVDPLMEKVFLRQPKTELKIEPYEPYREKFNLAASYMSGKADGTRPGIFYFSGYNVAERKLGTSINLYMHEGNPGHHFQSMFAIENEDLPEFMRYGGFTAFSEGWGLYAESLGYELGLYDDPVHRLEALQGGELLRAVRLVVDTGMHALGWSREKAIEYMVANGQPRDFAESETARYIVMPAQALAYKTGELKIKELRAKAQAALGDDFDVRKFHEQVLNTGDIPLPVLEAKIDAWIAGGGQ